MKTNERAAQIWPLLTYAAIHRQTLTYEILGNLIGVPRMAVGPLLEPIQEYCLKHGLPALTGIVVSEVNGDPRSGFSAAENVPVAREAVYRHDWRTEQVPGPDELQI